MRQEDQPTTNTISGRINEILDCGMRYAKYKMCLKRNREKADSRTLSYSYLLNRLKEEVVELEIELRQSEILDRPRINLNPDQLERIAQEAGDIICFASMICDKTEQI
jgi:NTP pyrophosphatase (non-canonical NTP hydrolase)